MPSSPQIEECGDHRVILCEPKETFRQRLTRGLCRRQQQPEWEAWTGPDWADGIMEVAATDDFHAKQGRSTGRWLVPTPTGEVGVYLKRHYRLPWWRGLMATFWPGSGWSPALQEWRHLHWARGQGLPVPEPLAVCEYIGPWGKLQSVLAVRELAGMLPLHQAIPMAAAQLDPATFACWKRGLIAELARLTRLLHERRHFHKDLYLCHFYIRREDIAGQPEWRDRVYVIDLHRLGHHPWTWRRWQAKDLGQLLYSSDVAGITARDRVRFWRFYLGAERQGRAGQWLRRLILGKWWLYRRHNRNLQKAASSPGQNRRSPTT